MSSASSSSSTVTAPPPPGFVTASGHTLSGPKFATITAPAHRKPDLLDKSVTFLAKRDGIDKVLKIIRYTTKLLLATSLPDPKSDLAMRLKAFESSVGTSRKAYRLGKWLADVNAMRKVPLTSRFAALELLSAGGSAVYYFTEQLTWLVKTGMIAPDYARRFGLVSAWAELVGYVGSVWLNVLRISAALERERALSQELTRRKKVGEQSDRGDEELRTEVQSLAERRFLRTQAVIQDLSDSLLAINDIRDGRGPLAASPALLSVCGLISAAISFRKNWPSS